MYPDKCPECGSKECPTFDPYSYLNDILRGLRELTEVQVREATITTMTGQKKD